MRRASSCTLPVAACAATILTVALALALAGCGGGDSRPAASDAHSPPADVTRTVLVYDHEPAPSPSHDKLHAGLLKGEIPDGTVKATVLSDENCEPDAKGISHCLNRVRLANGRTVTLRHPHNMNDVPCLVPGEEVLVSRA